MSQTQEDVRTNFLTFMIGLYAKHPHLSTRDLFLTGESYAGHYVPSIGNKLYFYNNNQFRLKGLAIGNGWTSPQVQQLAYVQYSKDNKLADDSLLDSLDAKFKVCQDLVAVNTIQVSEAAQDYCESLFNAIIIDPATGSPKFNYYNYKESCPVDGCIVLDNELAWLTDP